ncbi:condensation domain-containing protein [Clostridium sp. LP20]|uniref:condensation domain-containing protein n=1 Tax=Clostridium sp. LP20 TaxID=3418665 RepID=UPI003EE6DC14
MNEYITDDLGRFEFPIEGFTSVVLDHFDNDDLEDCTFNLTFEIELHGKLDLKRFERAMNKVIAANDSMRSSFRRDEDQYFIRVRKKYELTLNEVEIQGTTVEERKEEAYVQSKIVSQRVLDIYNNVGYRVNIFKIDDDEHLAVFAFHHALADGATLAMFIGTLLACYEHEEIELNQTGGTFLEYLREEYEYLNSDNSKQEVEYWQDKFESYECPVYEINENEELLESCDVSPIILDKNALLKVAKENKTSLFNVVALIYEMAIAKIEKRNDVALSFLLSARNDPKYKDTFGFITRATNIRYKFNNDEAICDIHKKIRKQVATAALNYKQAYPYVRENYILAYQNQSTGMAIPTFEGKEIDVNFVKLKRKPYWMLIRINEDLDKVITANECDTRKYTKEYLEQLRVASIEAQEMILFNPSGTFKEYLQMGKESNYENIITF